MRRHTPGRRDERGQAMVEFALVIPIFLLMLVAIFDLGRGVYAYNGVAEASREISRITSTNLRSAPAAAIGTSNATQDRIAAQRTLVPDMDTPTFSCVDLMGAASSCASGDYVKVTVTASYEPAVLRFWGPLTLSSTSSAQIP